MCHLLLTTPVEVGIFFCLKIFFSIFFIGNTVKITILAVLQHNFSPNWPRNMILVSVYVFGAILESVRSTELPDLYDRVARKHKFGPNSARNLIFSFLFCLYFVGDRSMSGFTIMRQAQALTSLRRWLKKSGCAKIVGGTRLQYLV